MDANISNLHPDSQAPSLINEHVQWSQMNPEPIRCYTPGFIFQTEVEGAMTVL